MVGRQGKHLDQLRQLRTAVIVEPEEGKMLRDMITRLDKKLIREWLLYNKNSTRNLRKSIDFGNKSMSKGELLYVTTKICCHYKLNIHHRTVKEVLLEESWN
jgi:hypothetical protein